MYNYKIFLDNLLIETCDKESLNFTLPNIISRLRTSYIPEYNTYLQEQSENGIIYIVGLHKNNITLYPKILNVLKIKCSNKNE